MIRKAIPTWCFAIVVVKRGDSYLIIQERKHKQRWYFPAGRVDQGESFADAARRETKEEAGIEVDLQGIVRIEHSPASFGARMRVIFLASARMGQEIKMTADRHSLRARWVTLEELADLQLRGREVQRLLKHVDQGGEIFPLTLLRPEGTAYRSRNPDDTWETE